MDSTSEQRYAAEEHGEDGDDTPVPMFVYDGPEKEITGPSGKKYLRRDYIGPKFTVAEAGIIAWALNSIAEDVTIARWDEASLGWIHYSGPTEGVRP